MNSLILENFIKQKDYVLKIRLFDIVRNYNLTVEEFILLIFFVNQDIPTFDVELITNITKVPVNKILDSFTSLSNKGLVSINVIKNNNIVSESVNLDNLYKSMVDDVQIDYKKEESLNIFSTFEKEFSRTLSPMEYEIINDWLSKNISEELILGALKEAIYNGVANLRYIDKIIYEWSKKGFKSMRDVNNHLSSKSSNVSDIKEYNWLDEE